MEIISVERIVEKANNLKNKHNCFVNITVEIRGHEPTVIEYFIYVEKIEGRICLSREELLITYEKPMSRKENTNV